MATFARRKNKMATTYGKVLRRIRIDRDELLKDMAEQLGMTSAYLSAIENGKRQVPNNMTDIIVDKYKLADGFIKELYNAEAIVKNNIEINLKNANNSQRTTALALARQFEKLTDKQLEEIQNILNEVGD